MSRTNNDRKDVYESRLAKELDRQTNPPIIDGTYEGSSFFFGNLNGLVIPLDQKIEVKGKNIFTTNGRFVETTLIPDDSSSEFGRSSLPGVWQKHINRFGQVHWDLQIADVDNDNGQWIISPTVVENDIIIEYDAIYLEKGYNTLSTQTPTAGYGFGKRISSDVTINGVTVNSQIQVDSDADTTRVMHLGIEYSYKEADSLYYYFAKAANDEEQDDSNRVDTNETNVEARYVDMLSLSDSIWENYTSDVITYEGLRYEPVDDITSLFYRETLHIVSVDSDGSVIGTIRASSIYEDSGTTSTTTVDSVSFPVQSAEGIYNHVKLIKISYDNDTYDDKNVRTLRLYY